MTTKNTLDKIEAELISKLKASGNIEKNKSGNYQIKGTRILISELTYFYRTALSTLLQQVGEEVWLPVIGYDGLYEVSSWGKVKSLRRKTLGIWGGGKMSNGKLLKQTISKFGYIRITLSKNGKPIQFSVHRIVAKAFIENPKELPCINHKDSNRTNNHIENLEWVTYKENSHHAAVNNRFYVLRGEDSKIAKLTNKDILQIRKEYEKNKVGFMKLGKKYGVDTTTIRSVIHGETWQHI